jgi:hypothetical protein
MKLNELLKVFWGNKIELYCGTNLVASGCTRSANIRGYGNQYVKSAFIKENQNEVVFAITLKDEE